MQKKLEYSGENEIFLLVIDAGFEKASKIDLC